MKSTVLIPSLLVGGGASAIGIVVSQTSSYDPMSSFIEYADDKRIIEASIQKISDLIKEAKDAFQKLKEKIDKYEKAFKDAKVIYKEDIGNSKAKELARTNFLEKSLEFLLKSYGISDDKKVRLKKEKDSLQEKIKKIETDGWEYGSDANRINGDIHEISKLASSFSEKIQELYEELFLLFKPYKSLISKNIGINRKKSLSALLSTAEKVGLLEEEQNTNYISSNLQFTRTIDTSDEKLEEKIKKNDFTVDWERSTLVLKTMNKEMWSFFDWNGSDSRKDLSDWNDWITNNR